MALDIKNPEPLWDSPIVSDYLGVPIGTLDQWACRGVGPAFARVGTCLPVDNRRGRVMDADKINDAAAIVHTTIPMRWNDPNAPVMADMEIVRVLDDLAEITDPVEQRDALRFLLMNLGWLAASGIYSTATALHRLAVRATRDQIAHSLVEAAIEGHKLTVAAFGDDEPHSSRWEVMKVEPMTNAVVTARTLQAFADQLPAWIDQRQHAAISQLVDQLVPVIDRRAGDLIGRAIEQLVPIIDQRAADIAERWGFPTDPADSAELEPGT